MKYLHTNYGGLVSHLDDLNKSRVEATSCVYETLILVFLQMEKLGLTQVDLARKIGVQRQQINRWFAGEGGINAKSLVALAHAVGLDICLKPRLRVVFTGEPAIDVRTTQDDSGEIDWMVA
jgi:DNA-binding XRE family transcriptional regulator